MALFLSALLVIARIGFSHVDWLQPWTWPLVTMVEFMGFPAPAQAWAWPGETLGDAIALFLLLSVGPLAYGLLDSRLLRPLILNPVSRFIDGIAGIYGRVLAISLAMWPLVRSEEHTSELQSH